MSNTNKPAGQQLTVKEFFDQNAIEVDEDWLGTNMIPVSSFNHCMVAYAAQQTAAKDARIAELEAQLKADEGLKLQTAEQAILTEMEGFWNEAQQKVWMPKLVRLIEQQTAALRKELEASLQDHMDSCLAIVDIKSELEAVKKERDGLSQIADQLRKDYERMEQYGNKITDQLSEVTRQRDEAVKNTVELCRKAFAAGMDLEESGGRGEDWKGFYNRELSRLSSGETKPASPESLTE